MTERVSSVIDQISFSPSEIHPEQNLGLLQDIILDCLQQEGIAGNDLIPSASYILYNFNAPDRRRVLRKVIVGRSGTDTAMDLIYRTPYHDIEFIRGRKEMVEALINERVQTPDPRSIRGRNRRQFWAVVGSQFSREDLDLIIAPEWPLSEATMYYPMLINAGNFVSQPLPPEFLNGKYELRQLISQDRYKAARFLRKNYSDHTFIGSRLPDEAGLDLNRGYYYGLFYKQGDGMLAMSGTWPAATLHDLGQEIVVVADTVVHRSMRGHGLASPVVAAVLNNIFNDYPKMQAVLIGREPTVKALTSVGAAMTSQAEMWCRWQRIEDKDVIAARRSLSGMHNVGIY